MLKNTAITALLYENYQNTQHCCNHEQTFHNDKRTPCSKLKSHAGSVFVTVVDSKHSRLEENIGTMCHFLHERQCQSRFAGGAFRSPTHLKWNQYPQLSQPTMGASPLYGTMQSWHVLTMLCRTWRFSR